MQTEAAALTIELVESLLITIAASLTSGSGTPSATCLFNSIAAAQQLLNRAQTELEAGHDR